jgi:MFS family permease
MSSDSGAEAPPPPPPVLLYKSYGVGLCSVTLIDLYAIIVPLFALSFGATPGEIGLLAGARAAGPAIFALHGGSLVDRMGSRRMLLICSTIVGVAALMIPALPWFWPLFILQFASGLFTTFNWIAAQTLVAQIGHGDAAILGRYNFIIRAGTVGGPVAAGALWDFGGAWPTFGAVAIASACLFLLATIVPEQHVDRAAAAPPPRLIEMLPRLSDFTKPLSLMLIPVICFTIVVSTLRNGTNGMQTSIFVVYLQSLDYPGTLIGVLFGAAEAAVACASLVVGTIKGIGRSEWVLLGTSVAAIVAICSTPFLGGWFPALFFMQVIFGGAQGFMQPIMFSIQSAVVGKDRQGSVVGLRLATNRVANMIIPPIAGAIADHAGLEASFIWVGAAFLTGCVIVGILILVLPSFRLKR